MGLISMRFWVILLIEFTGISKRPSISLKKRHSTIMEEEGKFCLKSIGTCNNLVLNGLLKIIACWELKEGVFGSWVVKYWIFWRIEIPQALWMSWCTVKKIFLLSNLNFPWSNLCLSPLLLSVWTHEFTSVWVHLNLILKSQTKQGDFPLAFSSS